MKNRAFTLVELLVALAILAIVAHLAVRQLSRVTNGKREQAADRQLEDIAMAVWRIDSDGIPQGFLTDMGRLPDASGGTLRELWIRPANAKAHTLVAASADNLAVADEEKANLADSAVLVPSGWRGPYLALPPGATRLYDPWGNPVETPDSAGLTRVWTTNGAAYAVSHYGPTAAESGETTLRFLPQSAGTCSLAITPELSDGFTGTVTYKLYAPCSGLVTGMVVRAEYPSPALFEKLTPGVKILKDSATGVMRRICVFPGGNIYRMKQ